MPIIETSPRNYEIRHLVNRGWKQREVADKFGISKTRVAQIYASVERKFRKAIELRKLREDRYAHYRH